jgi:hypothetical protein
MHFTLTTRRACSNTALEAKSAQGTDIQRVAIQCLQNDYRVMYNDHAASHAISQRIDENLIA